MGETLVLLLLASLIYNRSLTVNIINADLTEKLTVYIFKSNCLYCIQITFKICAFFNKKIIRFYTLHHNEIFSITLFNYYSCINDESKYLLRYFSGKMIAKLPQNQNELFAGCSYQSVALTIEFFKFKAT